MFVCNRCWSIKEREDFSRNPKMATGFLHQCKDCRREWTRDYREKNRDGIRAYQRSWAMRPDNKAKLSAKMAEWRALFPQRRAAQVAVNNAIRDGRLSRQPCWVCGKKAHAHHPDYSRPLDVVWLCTLHHMAAHALVEA